LGVNDCGNGPLSTEFTVEVEDCTGIENLSFTNPLISPNPVTDMLSLNFGNESIPSLNIEVFDMLGLLVFVAEVREIKYQTTLDLRFLDNGMYLLRLKTNQNSYTKKIVINR